MSIIAAKPIRTLRLDFVADDRKKLVRENLSAVAASGDQLWFGTDEDTLLDCLTEAGGDRYAGHKTFELKNSLQLPNTTGKKDEIDIEGLYVAGERLWLVGSHAITRDRPNPGEDGAKKALRDLSNVKKGPNRWTLASWALPQSMGAEPALGAAAQLVAGMDTSPLLMLLAEDPHLRAFLTLPAKENGFDIEGLAVTGQRLFLGLRGPVLRGWAVLLELQVEIVQAELKLMPNGPDGRCYRKHFLDLEGCGVRDLCFADANDRDLLVLAGPTMSLDGTVRLHRWPLPAAAAEDTITAKEGCPANLEIPHQRGKDRAEGIAVRHGQNGAELLVVYDSPAEARAPTGQTFVDADLFALPA